MEDSQKVKQHTTVEETKEANSALNPKISNYGSTVVSQDIKYKWWLRIVIYVILVLAGQTVAILLGRLYYVEGGKSRWVATLIQLAGFPILLVYYCIISLSCCKNNPTTTSSTISSDLQAESRSLLIVALASVYVSLGLINGANCFLLSIGQYLPISTVTLISASQLTFNAFFSFLFNSQKFTPLTINSLVLLSCSQVFV